MEQHKLSVLIPCFNEEATIQKVLEKVTNAVLALNIPAEIIIINDGSTDETTRNISLFKPHPDIPVCELIHANNQGKGACIRSSLNKVNGSIVIIQDADLEYDPFDFQKMIPLITEGKADVVYGSRFRGSEPHRVLFFFHTIGNKLLTFASNIFTNINLSDMETGYKMFRTEILKQIQLKENRFGFEPEITAKISRIRKIRIYEVGISYYGRTYEDGKKINWKDGLRALYCIIKYNLFTK